MNINNKSRRLIFFLGLLLATFIANAQQNLYVVKFKDKNNSPYSINRPIEFLSQKAIDRRQRQQINCTTEDFPINPIYKSGVATLGVRIRLELKWFNSIVIQTTSDKIPPLLALSFVESIVSLGPVPSPLQTSIKPFFKNEVTDNPSTKKSASAIDYGLAKAQIEQVNGHLLHKMNLQGQGMTIAVLDAGFRNFYTLAVFDSLRISGRIKGVRDFTFMPNFLDELDDSHGTEVLSIMAGWLNNEQIGTATNADYYLIRTEDSKSETPIEEYNWAAGAAFADSVGADIISSSLGYNIFDPAYAIYNHTYNELNGRTIFVSRAAAKAAAHGILVVNAAGNEGKNSWKHIIAPADVDTLLTVGAVNVLGITADFSSLGPSFNGRIKPDITANGWGTIIANPLNNNLISGNGTSFSTPLIAGLCACLWQGNPKATNLDIINALRFSASNSDSPNNVKGYGIANFYNAYLLLKKVHTNTGFPKPVYVISANPFQERLQLLITSPSSSEWTVDIYTIQGSLVERNANVSSNRPILIGNKLKSGIYILRILSGSQIATVKIIKK